MKIAIKGNVPQKIVDVLSNIISGDYSRYIRTMRHGKYKVINLPKFYRGVIVGDKIICMSHERYNHFQKNSRA